MLRTIILVIGWPVLIIGSIYLFLKGKGVYKLVKGSVVGQVTKVLVYSMLVGMYSLGIVTTTMMYCEIKSVYLAIPIFLVWFIMFIWTLKTLVKAQGETQKLMK
ncbi:MAG: hypothetical protein ABIE43_03645 [Patescibacteria group bacterium]